MMLKKLDDAGDPPMPPDAAMAGAAPTIPPDEAEAAGGLEVPVPLEAVAMPGEDDIMNTPSVGDPVQLQAEGKVTRIEGQTAFVSIKSVNGKPVSSEAAKTTDTPPDDGSDVMAQLRSEAATMPPRE